MLKTVSNNSPNVARKTLTEFLTNREHLSGVSAGRPSTESERYLVQAVGSIQNPRKHNSFKSTEKPGG